MKRTPLRRNRNLIKRQKKGKEYSVQDIISKTISNLNGNARKQIQEFGSIVNVNSDGNCGYYSIILGLLDLDISVPMIIDEFCKDIHNYVTDNEE